MITVYSAPGCRHCTTTKDFLKNNNRDFHEVNVAENPEVIDSLKEKNFKQFPVVITDNDEWSGHNEEKLSSLVS